MLMDQSEVCAALGMRLAMTFHQPISRRGAAVICELEEVNHGSEEDGRR